MKSISASLLLFINLASAVNLYLWKNPDSCSGSGIVCVNIPEETCCENGDLFGYGEALYPPQGMTSVAQLFARQNGLNCGINYGPVKPIPVCLITGLDLSVSGIAWEFQSGSKKRFKRGDMISHSQSVIGDPAYKEGDTVYVISKEKMASANLKTPDDATQLAAFFKTHADSVLKQEPTTSVVQVNQADSSEPAGEKSK